MNTYIVKHGDTLQGISQRVLKDSSRYLEIAEINDLQYPFISDEDINNTHIKTPGDVIILPVDNPILETSFKHVRNDGYTSDLILANKLNTFSDAGDVQVDAYGDLLVSDELVSLQQDLLHCLFTPIGSLLLHPDYGSHLHDIIGHKRTMYWRELCEVEITRVLYCDPRVKEVKKVVIQDIPSGFSIFFTCVTNKGIVFSTKV